MVSIGSHESYIQGDRTMGYRPSVQQRWQAIPTEDYEPLGLIGNSSPENVLWCIIPHS
jgi:hypothetical protein